MWKYWMSANDNGCYATNCTNIGNMRDGSSSLSSDYSDKAVENLKYNGILISLYCCILKHSSTF